MIQADRIRQYVVERFIDPARREGRESVSVLVKDVRNGMGKELGEYPDPTAISQALGVEKFLTERNLEILKQRGWAGYDYKIVNINSLRQLSESEPKEDFLAKLHEHVGELTQDEFENLVRAYMKAKGFSNVEITFALKMKT